MPIVKIYGWPKLYEHKIEEAEKRVKEAITSVRELELEEKDIVIFFLKELKEIGENKSVIIFVDGLFKKPNRTEEVKQTLATKVAKSINEIFSNEGRPRSVECFVRSFDAPTEGFAKVP